MPQRAPNREKTGSLWDAFWPSSRRRRRLPRLPGQWLRRTSIAGWVILLAVLVLLARLGGRGPTPEPPIAPLDTGEVRVGRVIDGDTLELSDGTKVRLIGVDTPELARAGRPAEPFAHEAARFTEQFLSQGPVRLELDPYERQDRYGRRLAYVWVGQRMLNEELLLAGLARARLEFGYSEVMKVRFAQAEAQARQARRGLWGFTAP